MRILLTPYRNPECKSWYTKLDWNTKLGIQSLEYKDWNTKLRIQRLEYKDWNTKLRIQNLEYKTSIQKLENKSRIQSLVYKDLVLYIISLCKGFR